LKPKGQLQKIKEDLDGTEGIIYIMFCGREVYVSQIQQALLDAGIFKNKENVNQAFYRLLKHEMKYLIFKRELKAPGKPKVYTANLEPIFITLKHLNLHERFDKTELLTIIEKLSNLNDNFPKIYTAWSREENGTLSYKRITWYDILSVYFLFLSSQMFNIGSSLGKIKISKKMKELETQTRTSSAMMPLGPLVHALSVVFESLEKSIGQPKDNIVIKEATPENFGCLLKTSLALVLEDTPVALFRPIIFKTLDPHLSKLIEYFKKTQQDNARS